MSAAGIPTAASSRLRGAADKVVNRWRIEVKI
jgi:hypothetical protein